MGEVDVDADGVPVLRRVHVTYRLAADRDLDRDRIDRLLVVHQQKCPVYRSLAPQIKITTAIEYEADRS